MNVGESMIEEIRMLPMSEEDEDFTGKDISFVQNWFLEYLPFKTYYSKTNKLKVINGKRLILFRYKNAVIASAILEAIFKDIKSRPGYSVGYYFDPHSIKIFAPLNKDEIKGIWPNVGGYGQAALKLDTDKYDEFITLIESRGYQTINEKRFEEEVNEIQLPDTVTIEDKPEEKSKKERTSNTWKRNSLISKKGLLESDYTCLIDSNHKTFRAKSTNRNYVEAHHLVPMQYQDNFDYSLDVVANITSLCPNCHALIHFGSQKEKEPLLRKLYDERINRLIKCKIDITFDQLKQFY